MMQRGVNDALITSTCYERGVLLDRVQFDAEVRLPVDGGFLLAVLQQHILRGGQLSTVHFVLLDRIESCEGGLFRLVLDDLHLVSDHEGIQRCVLHQEDQ